MVSVGSVGSSYDNALAESINGLYKTELIKPRGPGRTLDAVEIATTEFSEKSSAHNTEPPNYPGRFRGLHRGLLSRSPLRRSLESTPRRRGR